MVRKVREVTREFPRAGQAGRKGGGLKYAAADEGAGDEAGSEIEWESHLGDDAGGREGDPDMQYRK